MAAAEEDLEYLKLPVEERCVHKLWKARQSGFDECVKLFPQWDASDASWKKFNPIIKKFVNESNAIVLESGLEATLTYLENCDAASKNASDIIDGLIAKCIGAPKAKTKELAKQNLLMLCEIEAHERVIDDLLSKGLVHKNPKIVSGSLSALTNCLHHFGAKVIKVSPLLKATIPLLDHRDKTIREEGKSLIIESYRWVGDIMKQQLTSLKQVQLTELETEFAKVSAEGSAKPDRYLRSQMPTTGTAGDDDNVVGVGVDAADGEGDAEAEESDPFELLDPVDILSQLPKNFYELVEEKKWQLRKEALDALLPLTKTPKIANGDFQDLVRALNKFIGKDTNVMLVAQAAQCLGGLAKGLRANFKNHASQSLSVVLEKFKEKKSNVVSALVETVDALYPCLGIEGVQEDCLAALKHKTPSVNAETAKFLARSFSKCPPQLVTNKKVCKGYVSALLDRLTHSDVTVRDAASEALGVLMKFLGEPNVVKFMPDLDNIKMAKIKEFEGKAVLTGKPASAIAAKQQQEQTKAVRGGAKVVKPAKGSTDSTKASSDETEADKKPVRASSAAKGATKGGPPRLGGGAKGKLNLVKSSTTKPSAAGTSAASSSARRKGEDFDTAPLYVATPNLKNARFRDETKLKILKWNFSSPRQEFVDQLKEQMTNANFNKSLIAQLFHNDFKQHLKAIEALSNFLNEDDDEASALTANLDLLLKWMTLRFFETNPSVMLKVLEYLQDVFGLLAERGYHLHDIEGVSFVPYLVNKVGDPKDQVRNSVKNILRMLCKVYPASKMSGHLMNGLSSKNAKQRAECLDELGHLIRNFGSSVLQAPSVAACLKEIAKQISDRDNSVRSAALNCMAETYFQDGDKLYRVIGNLPEKDMAMLEERIKRQAKSRPIPPMHPSSSASNVGRVNSTQQPTVRGGAGGGAMQSRLTRPNTVPANLVNQNSASEQAKLNRIPSPQKMPTSSRPISGAFTLDLDKIESAVGTTGDSGLRLVNHNLDDIFNDEPIKLPSTLVGRYGGVGSTFHSNSSPNANCISSPLATTKTVELAEMPEAYEALDLVLSQMFNEDSETCISAMIQLDELITDKEKAILLAQRMDRLFAACFLQYRRVLTSQLRSPDHDPKEVMRIFKYVTMVLMSVYQQTELTCKASVSSLHDLVHIIISILLDDQVQKLPDSSQLIRALNILTVKIVERSDHTNIASAFIKLLKECIGNNNLSKNYSSLVMKCLWKITKLLPNWLDEDINQVDVDLLLVDFHAFLKAFPRQYWKQKQQSEEETKVDDMPMRTIKTLIFTLVNLMGEEILAHTKKISDPENSELIPYLRKLLSTSVEKESNQRDGGVGGSRSMSTKNTAQPPATRLLKGDHEALAEILKKIGQKELTKQGLNELYNFKKQNPQADLEPFLARLSQNFRDYIEDGLKRIAQEKAVSNSGASMSSAAAQSTNTHNDYEKSNGSHDSGRAPHSQYFLDRLKKLREQGGLESSSDITSTVMSVKATSSSSSASSVYRIAATATTTRSINNDQGVEDLKKRLERIKQSDG